MLKIKENQGPLGVNRWSLFLTVIEIEDCLGDVFYYC